jgi:hypothetical protein
MEPTKDREAGPTGWAQAVEPPVSTAVLPGEPTARALPAIANHLALLS